MTAELLAQFEALIRRDPGRRGLIGDSTTDTPLCPGELAAAAKHLAGHGQHVAVTTGFFIPAGTPPAAETDGPLGALFLAAGLHRAGLHAWVITDEPCAAAVQACALEYDFPLAQVLVAPVAAPEFDDWSQQFWQEVGSSLTHLISLERVGPSHTPASWERQPENRCQTRAEFETVLPVEDQDHCHNMRGEVIDGWTAPLYKLFEEFPLHCPTGRTIGIGDGGNEIGMGRIPWTELSRRLQGPQRFRVPCRIATDWTIVAGTSNWGGYALTAATLLLRGAHEVLRDFTQAQQLAALEHSIQAGPSVDGVTRQQTATVDGLPFLTYIQPWLGMRHLFGWDTNL